MRLIIPDLDINFSLETGVNLLSIANRSIYRRIFLSLKNKPIENPLLLLFKDEAGEDIKESQKFLFAEPLEKQNLDSALSKELYLQFIQWLNIQQKASPIFSIEKYFRESIGEYAASQWGEYTIDEVSLLSLLKTVRFSPVKKENILEDYLNFFHVLRDLGQSPLFIFLGLQEFYEKNEFLEFEKEVFLQKFEVLCIERNEDLNANCGRRKCLLDKDFYAIYE